MIAVFDLLTGIYCEIYSHPSYLPKIKKGGKI